MARWLDGVFLECSQSPECTRREQQHERAQRELQHTTSPMEWHRLVVERCVAEYSECSRLGSPELNPRSCTVWPPWIARYMRIDDIQLYDSCACDDLTLPDTQHVMYRVQLVVHCTAVLEYHPIY